MEELHRLIADETNAAAMAAAAENHRANDSAGAEECRPGWGGGCQDNPLYKTSMGLDCSQHVVMICDQMVKIGFTAAAVDELILNCPCSCNIECGTWTQSPTPGPTMLPTVSPTPRPSASPTPLPSGPPALATASMLTDGPLPVFAEGRAELPSQSASPDEGVALWVVYSAAGVGVALAAFVVGYVLGTKRGKSQAEDTTQSRGKRARKVPPTPKSRSSATKDKYPSEVQGQPPPPKSRSSAMKDKHPSEVQGQPFFCETIDDDDKDLEANAQRQGEHRREGRARSRHNPADERRRSRSRSRRQDGHSEDRHRGRSRSQRRVPHDSLALSPTADLSEASSGRELVSYEARITKGIGKYSY